MVRLNMEHYFKYVFLTDIHVQKVKTVLAVTEYFYLNELRGNKSCITENL